MVSFPVDAYSGSNSALNVGYPNPALNVGYTNPASTLPTSVVGGLTTSTVHPASTLSSILLTISSMPLLTDIATAAITTTTVSVVVDSVSSKLATGLEFLALAPGPLGVETQPAGQTLSVPAAAMPTVQPFTATTPAAVQPPGSLTTVTTAEPASTAATVAASTAPPESTMTSSAVPTTPTATVAASTVLPASTTTTSAAVTAPFPQ